MNELYTTGKQDSTQGCSVKVATWNIFRGKNIVAVLHALRQLNADVIALQEVSEVTVDGRSVNAAEYLAGELKMDYFYCKTLTNDRVSPRYELGNAILSRLPIASQACAAMNDSKEYLGAVETEPRNACVVKVLANDGELQIISTHLYHPHHPKGDELSHIGQFERIADTVDGRYTILMGDFNAETTSAAFDHVEAKLNDADDGRNQPTFTNIKYDAAEKRSFDHIFVTKDVTVHEYTVHDSDASDHLPVSCTIGIP